MKKAVFIGVPVILLLALVAWRFAGRSALQAKVANQARAAMRSAAVEVADVKSQVIEQTLETVGSVESPYKIEISPKTAGRIEYLQAREGDKVLPGQVLLKIDPSDLQGALVQQEASVAEARSRLAQAQLTQNSTNVGIASQIKQQQAGLGSVQANYDQVKANYDAQVAAAQAQVSAAASAVANAQAALDKENANLRNTQTKYDRTFNLYKQGFTAAQDVDDARTALDVEKGSVAVAQAAVAAAKSQLNVQQQNLAITKRKGLSDIEAGRASVTQAQATLQVAQANRSQSPAYRQNLAALQSQVDAAVAGVRQAQARLSDTVIRSTIAGTVTARKADPGALASPGSPVLEIQYLDWLYVNASVPIESAGLIRQGETARVSIDGFPGRTFDGPITNINPAADPQSRQFTIRIRLDNKDHLLQPGMYGRVQIVTGRIDASAVVPREAISTKDDGTSTVTVVDSDGIAHVNPAKLGATDGKDVQLLEGAKQGDKVIVLTYSPVKDGAKVTLGKPDSAAPPAGGKGRRRRPQ